MPSQSAVVGSSVGLHARPASLIAQAAGELDDDVTLAFGGKEADAASALLIMTLGAKQGDTVEVSGENADDVARIAELVEQDLDA